MPHRFDPWTIGFLSTDISRLMRAAFERRIARTGIGVSGAEARVLANAARAGAVRQNVLAEILQVEAMTLTGLLDRLERRGLVRRLPDPSDRRAKLVELTEAAADVLAGIAAVSAEVRLEASLGLTELEWAQLLAMLKRVRSNLAAVRTRAAVETDAA